MGDSEEDGAAARMTIVSFVFLRCRQVAMRGLKDINYSRRYAFAFGNFPDCASVVPIKSPFQSRSDPGDNAVKLARILGNVENHDSPRSGLVFN